MNWAKLLFCLLGIVFCNFINNVAGRLEAEGIVGGQSADINQFPYVVSIQVGDLSICTGGILDYKYILTAAHCFEDNVIQPYRVVAGVSNLELSHSFDVNVEKIYIHENFERSTLKDDIAVIKLVENLPVDRVPNLKKLLLPTAHADYMGKTAVVAGFGAVGNRIEYNDTTGQFEEVATWFDNMLHFTNVYNISKSECSQEIRTFPIFDTDICGFSHQHDPLESEGVCTGDSGAPLVLDGVVIGILKYRPLDCTDITIPSGYSRTSSYLPFIHHILTGRPTSGFRLINLIEGHH